MQKIQKRISELSTIIEDSGKELANVVGRIGAEEDYQKKQFGVSNSEELEEKKEEVEKEIEKLKRKVLKLYEQLENEIEW